MEFPEYLDEEDMRLIIKEWKLAGGIAYFSPEKRLVHVAFVDVPWTTWDDYQWATYRRSVSGVWTNAQEALGADDWEPL